MSFWTNQENEPKRNYRFKVAVGAMAEGESDIVWYAKKVTKPAFTIGETTHKLLNHTFHFPSTVTWEMITLTMVDPINPSVTNSMLSALTAGGYILPTRDVDTTTVSKTLMGKALGTVVITHLDADGQALETWTLKNSFIKSVKFSDLDYDSEDLSTCDLEIRYDWATMTASAGGSTAPAGPTHTFDPFTTTT